MDNSKDREKVAKEIAKTSDSIRKKYRALKTGKMNEDIALERRFKPIVDPLKQIVENTADSSKDPVMTETIFSREDEELKLKRKRPSALYDNPIQASTPVKSIFAENLIAVELRKLEVKFNKPIYVGMCILDISKVCLYEFHHEYMSPMYHDKCKIMYSDTDSLIDRIECDDAYETMKRDIARFDTSDYPVENAYGMPLANKKVPGLMKDENNGMIMTEIVGLKAKMYSVRVDGKKDIKKVKGVKSNVVARTITFDDYARCLNEEIEMTRRQSCIRSKLHEVYTISESKIALSPYDDKRYVVPDSTETLSWGHWRIPL
ncbi:hypothetical protein ALC57_05866 [Trachymyrmex cornetzi]|uniref:Uncharacterized protein n=1 Tax=Trachymyrmex cornetzi TaxID=471704 RepID=A0A151J9L6_9HYME|nr:hypothetical protein ALC57_05866 [Trachymyrmex cornetzi]